MKKTIILISIVFLFITSIILNKKGTNLIYTTQPSWYFLSLHSYKKFLHILSVSFGFRTLAGDFEYISFLQYYGNINNRKTKYKLLYKYLNNITDIDPNFIFAYTYGSAILAFNLERYDEAIAFIKKGIKYNPKFWRLRLYLGGIIYKKKGEFFKYVEFLEDTLKFKDHPAMIERILGNIYETYKEADFVALYWLKIFNNTKDTENKKYAYEHIKRLIVNKKIKKREVLEEILKVFNIYEINKNR